MQTATKKIVTIDELSVKAKEYRDSGKKVVLCHGIFDLIHAGHIRYLKSALSEGDVLFVTITADEFVNKGPGRPVFSQELRAENLGHLNFVDYVAVNQAPTAVNVISELKPHAYAKGNDYKNLDDDITGNIHLEKQAVEEGGGKIIMRNMGDTKIAISRKSDFHCTIRAGTFILELETEKFSLTRQRERFLISFFRFITLKYGEIIGVTF